MSDLFSGLPSGPAPLPANALPQRMDFARALRINVPIEAAAPPVPPPRPLFSVRRGRTVVLAFNNRADGADSGENYSAHIHAIHQNRANVGIGRCQAEALLRKLNDPPQKFLIRLR